MRMEAIIKLPFDAATKAQLSMVLYKEINAATFAAPAAPAGWRKALPVPVSGSSSSSNSTVRSAELDELQDNAGELNASLLVPASDSDDHDVDNKGDEDADSGDDNGNFGNNE